MKAWGTPVCRYSSAGCKAWSFFPGIGLPQEPRDLFGRSWSSALDWLWGLP